jgi:hypothetical protein
MKGNVCVFMLLVIFFKNYIYCDSEYYIKSGGDDKEDCNSCDSPCSSLKYVLKTLVNNSDSYTFVSIFNEIFYYSCDDNDLFLDFELDFIGSDFSLDGLDNPDYFPQLMFTSSSMFCFYFYENVNVSFSFLNLTMSFCNNLDWSLIQGFYYYYHYYFHCYCLFN